ncbi:MAG: gliding motility-associated C-terminal domain-containing protein [Taibaiella sp.]|nr:gliding motility-associated C-terminal domain-containing protein [Taibaiella sp.]
MFSVEKKRPVFIRSSLFFILSLLLAATLNTAVAQVNVNPGQSAAALAARLAGQGVTIINPVMKCGVYANGFFTSVKSNLGIDSGIVLSTGRAGSSPGFYGINGYCTALASTDNGFPGDSALTKLAGQKTIDACKLEFDVIPMGDTISIGYVFSSEEYISAVCGPYNDVFAFFISGPGISGTDNMALVPGTTIPVAINSINNGVPGSSDGDIVNCTSMGTGSPFTAYYVDNANGNSITHRGFTTVLKAIHAVTECTRYHLQIAIADAGNAKYDSGVFLEAGSLQSGHFKIDAIPAPVRDTLAPICVKGCLSGHFRIKATKTKATAQTIKFIAGGTAVAGVDYAPVADSVVLAPGSAYAYVTVTGIPTPLNGVKTLTLYILSPSVCASTSSVVDSATILIYDTLHITAHPADTIVCGGDTVKLNVSGDAIYSYHWAPFYNISNINAQSPLVYPFNATTYSVTASLPGSTCPFRSAAVRVAVKVTPHVALMADTIVCFGDAFTPAPVVTPPGSIYSYAWAGPVGFAATTKDISISNVARSDNGKYLITVTNDTNGCTGSTAVNLVVNKVEAPETINPVVICLQSAPSSLYAAGDNIRWYATPGGAVLPGAPAPATDMAAQYTYYVTQTTGQCESPRAEVLAEVKKCCDGNIFIPTAFTPNNDGRNDEFRVIAGYGYYVKNTVIYNRWGQPVYSGNSVMWNGMAGGTDADAGVYFYRIIFGCISGGNVEKTGDITLIR